MTPSKGRVISVSAIVAIAAWSSSAMAKLPAGVEPGFRRLLLTVAGLLALSVASMAVGAVLAKKIAPNNHDLRQLIISLITVLGIGGGAMLFLLR